MQISQSLIVAATFASVLSVVARQASAAYRDEVLADSPLAYYEFEEAVGATVAVDSSPNGNDSVFVGSRSVRKSFDPGYYEAAGLNTVFGGAGVVGNSIELLNVDSLGWENAADPASGCGPFVQDCIDYKGGGYIQTGVTLDINDDDTNPANGNNPIDWSVEISIKNDDITIGPTTFEEYILTQRQFGPDDVQILRTGDLNSDREGPLADKTYRSGFGKVTSNATDTSFDPNTPETNAGNLLTFEGEWETIVFTFQASTNEMRWYSQGQLINTDVLANPDFNSVDDAWFLGVNQFFNWQHYPSIQVDEFSVYNYRLSDARIAAHFDALAAPGQPGDFDGDGDVDGADFLKWQRDLVDASSLSLWETNFGDTSAVAATATVPEPASLLLAGMMAATLAVWRRRLH